jgi:hypothetical protein
MRAEKAEARADEAEVRVRILEKELFEMALTYKVPRLASKKGRKPGRPRTRAIDFINMAIAFRELPPAFRNDLKARDNVSEIARRLLDHPRYSHKKIDERSMQRKVRNIITFYIENLTRPTDRCRRELALDLLFGPNIRSEKNDNEVALVLISPTTVEEFLLPRQR